MWAHWQNPVEVGGNDNVAEGRIITEETPWVGKRRQDSVHVN